MSHRLLLVEDNDSDEKLTLRAFAKSGIPNEIDVARDGVEALEYLLAEGAQAHRSGAPLPSLVLLDLNLPRVDGIEVLRRIRAHERTRLLPVVILTSSMQDKDLTQSYANGANGYVQKPIDFVEFADSIKTLATFWLLVNERAPEVT